MGKSDDKKSRIFSKIMVLILLKVIKTANNDYKTKERCSGVVGDQEMIGQRMILTVISANIRYLPEAYLSIFSTVRDLKLSNSFIK